MDFITICKEYPNILKESIILRNEYAQSIESTYDEKRLAVIDEYIERNIKYFFENLPLDSGMYGKIFEITTHDSNSRIIELRKKDKGDGYVLIDGKRKKVEVKTGGGRIGDYYKMSKPKRKATYLIYNLCFQPKDRTLKDGSISVSPIRFVTVFTTVERFLTIAESVKGAIKTAEHKNYEYIGKTNDAEPALQKSSKKLYEALLQYDIIFDRNKNYSSSEILR